MSDNQKENMVNENTVVSLTLTPFSVVFILDQSGSMNSMGNEPVDGLNNFYKEQNESGKFFSTLVFFSDKTKFIHENIDGKDVKELKYEDYVPNGMTALYDAIGVSIAKQESVKTENVIFVILTDGHENSSREYTCKQIKDKITKMEKEYNWKFVYLGANQDAFEVGNSLGIHRSYDYNYTQAGCKDVFRGVSHGLSSCISHADPDNDIEINLESSVPSVNL